MIRNLSNIFGWIKKKIELRRRLNKNNFLFKKRTSQIDEEYSNKLAEILNDYCSRLKEIGSTTSSSAEKSSKNVIARPTWL